MTGSMAMMVFLLISKYTLLYAVVLMLVALGGMFSERSGVINIALEGIMVIGGLVGVIVSASLMNHVNPYISMLLSILASALSGLIYSSLLAFASINLRANQTIGGTALNILATAIAMVVAKRFNGSQSAKIDYNNSAYLINIKTSEGTLTINVFLILGIVLLILSYVVLYKTRLGLRLRACGEHPQAAASVGINVFRMRYLGTMISGALAGLGGYAYIATVYGL